MAVLSKNILFKISVIISVVTLVLCILLTIEYVKKRAEVMAPAQQRALLQSNALAQEIETTLNQSVSLAIALTDSLHHSHLNKQKVIEHLKHALNTNSNLLGIGVAYEPFSYDPDVRLFAPYLLRQPGTLKRIQLEYQVDYSMSEYEWYHHPLRNGPGWNEPRFSLVADQMVVEYAAPFFRTDPDAGQVRIMGIVYLHYAMESILKQIETVNMGINGYGLLLSDQATILSHPTMIHLHGAQSALSIAAKTNNTLLEQIGRMAMAGQSGSIEGGRDLNNLSVRGNIHHIPTTKWTLAMLYSKEDLTMGIRPLRHRMTWITVTFIIFALTLIMMDLFRSKERLVINLGFRALLASTFFSLGIIIIWFLSTDDIVWRNTEWTVILDQHALDSFEKNNTRTALRNRQPLPIHIPTGVFVQSIKFTSANNVILTGYVWQEYSNNIPDDIARGFVLPEAESSEIVESYRRENEDGEVIGWYFQVELRQQFDYTRYPFDQQTVWIRLWHEDFDKNVVLLPALDSYDQIHPWLLPGIEKDFVLPGWEVTSSFFNYRFNNYNTDFGIPRYVGQEEFPELYFQIGVKRLFLNPFISNFTPIIVVLLLLFAVLITSCKESSRINLLGFNASAVLASSSALFFVVLISHIDLRGSLADNHIFYMEYFYVVTYIALLAISINSILFSWGVNIPFVQFRDNLLPKLFYWPVITLIMFIVTLWKFY